MSDSVRREATHDPGTKRKAIPCWDQQVVARRRWGDSVPRLVIGFMKGKLEHVWVETREVTLPYMLPK